MRVKNKSIIVTGAGGGIGEGIALRLAAEGAVANPATPQAFGQYIAAEIARWKPVITSGRVKAD